MLSNLTIHEADVIFHKKPLDYRQNLSIYVSAEKENGAAGGVGMQRPPWVSSG